MSNDISLYKYYLHKVINKQIDLRSALQSVRMECTHPFWQSLLERHKDDPIFQKAISNEPPSK